MSSENGVNLVKPNEQPMPMKILKAIIIIIIIIILMNLLLGLLFRKSKQVNERLLGNLGNSRELRNNANIII